MMQEPLKIYLDKLQECDDWVPVMLELEQVLIKLHNMTRLGKKVNGIIEIPSFVYYPGGDL